MTITRPQVLGRDVREGDGVHLVPLRRELLLQVLLHDLALAGSASPGHVAAAVGDNGVRDFLLKRVALATPQAFTFGHVHPLALKGRHAHEPRAERGASHRHWVWRRALGEG